MAPPLERGGEPDIYETLCSLKGDHPLSNGKDVGVVMLAPQTRRIVAPSDGAADSLYLVGGDGLSVSGSTKDDSFVGLSARHLLGGGDAPEGVIGRVRGMRAAVDDLVALRTEHFGDGLLVFESSVVAAKGDFHGLKLALDRVDLDGFHLHAEFLKPGDGPLGLSALSDEFQAN